MPIVYARPRPVTQNAEQISHSPEVLLYGYVIACIDQRQLYVKLHRNALIASAVSSG